MNLNLLPSNNWPLQIESPEINQTFSENSSNDPRKSPFQGNSHLICPALEHRLHWCKLGMPHAEPMTFLSLRFLIAISFLMPLVWWYHAPWPFKSLRLVACWYCWFVGPRGYLGGVFVAIKGGLPAALAALIVGLQPLLTGILAGPLLGEMLTRKKWIGLFLGFLGVWMVVSEKLPEENSFGMDSIFFASLALVSITLGTLYQKRFATKLDIRTGAVIQFISALTIFGLLSLSLETMVVEWTFESIFALFWLALVLSIGAILILMRLIQSGAAANVASLFYLVPPATAVEAWWLFDEKLGWLAIVGMLVAVLGVAMVVQQPQSQSKASEG